MPEASRSKQPPPAPVPLFAIFAAFFRIGMLAFGGGLTAWIYREAVQLRGWLDEEEFASALALAQILPGVNIGNMAIYIGQRLRGLAGASVALLGLLAVPFFAVILLLLVYDRIAGAGWLDPTLEGITAGALGLLIFTGLAAGLRSSGKSLSSWLVIIVTFTLVGVLQWPLLPVVLGVAPMSIALTLWRRRQNA